jgi:ketosteroid isomerase-like protein
VIVAGNESLIQTFYESFQKRDGAAMAACYAPDVRFWDPVFLDLEGFRAGAMWQMLTGRAADLSVEFSAIEADETRGRAHWDARYTFSTGRRVLNRIDAEFEFKDGKIVRHRDSFSLWRWSSQALGPVGVLLGWSPIVTGKIRAQAAKGLAEYIAKNSLGE